MIAPQILEPCQPIISVGTMEILSLLAEIYTKPDLQLSLEYNIEVAIFFSCRLSGCTCIFTLLHNIYVFMNVGLV